MRNNSPYDWNPPSASTVQEYGFQDAVPPLPNYPNDMIMGAVHGQYDASSGHNSYNTDPHSGGSNQQYYGHGAYQASQDYPYGMYMEISLILTRLAEQLPSHHNALIII